MRWRPWRSRRIDEWKYRTLELQTLLDAATGVTDAEVEDLYVGALPPRKHEALCCQSRRDADGRLPIGWCSPECIRRPR